MAEPHGSGLSVGDEVEVDVTAIAHGGHCIARHHGQVLFVRHTIPGERVLARVTETGAGERFVRADAVAVLTASPDRVPPPCPWAGPGRCGGCDFQHVRLSRQRALKADVVREQLARLAHLEVEVVVEPVPGDAEGLDWRTRVEFAVDAEGRAGLRRHRSHEVVPIDHCRIAAPGIDRLRVTEQRWPGADAVDAVAPSVGEPLAVALPLPEGAAVPVVHERVEATWTAADGGWQLCWASWPSRLAGSGRCTLVRCAPSSRPSWVLPTPEPVTGPSTSTPGWGCSPRRSPPWWAPAGRFSRSSRTPVPPGTPATTSRTCRTSPC